MQRDKDSMKDNKSAPGDKNMDHENRREERGPLRRGFQGEEREQRKIGAKARNCCCFIQRRRYPRMMGLQQPSAHRPWERGLGPTDDKKVSVNTQILCCKRVRKVLLKIQV